MTSKFKTLFILKSYFLGIISVFHVICIPNGYAITTVQNSDHLYSAKNNKYLSINSVKKNCPRSFEVLMTQLLHDLPSYANRVAQKSRRSNQINTYSYIILAGKPELKALPLRSSQYKSLLPNNTKQAFFTTLERHYSKKEVFRLQNHYRIFLSKETDSWRLISLSSKLAHIDNSNGLSLPSRNSINSAVGQGIRLWLRDCRVGTL